MHDEGLERKGEKALSIFSCVEGLKQRKDGGNCQLVGCNAPETRNEQGEQF